MRIVARFSEASCGTPLARRVRRNEIKESKTFFFEKKTQKTFKWAAPLGKTPQSEG
jgi:hypothetical protein